MSELKPNSPVRILVVDDEPLIRKSVREILTDEGYEVDEACDVNDCLDRLKHDGPYRLVLLDIMMPGENGLDAFKRKIKSYFDADTVFMSGHGTIDTAVEALRHGALDFLEKPFSTARLKEAVNRAIHKEPVKMAGRNLDSVEGAAGRFKLIRKIAEGGSASVFEAVQENLGRKVALKILHAHLTSESGFLVRFEREAKMTARLSHPGIVQIIDYGRSNDSYYLAMEYLEGDPLKNFLTPATRLAVPEIVRLVTLAADALDHAHGEGVIHRDIKPSNLIRTREGQLKVVDFGIARCLEAGGGDLTRTEQIVGTPLFMSPEQVDGRPVLPQSDLFALGIVLYYLLTLEPPFKGEGLAGVLKAVANCKYKDPRTMNKDISDGLMAVLAKCLEKDPLKRYASGRALAEALTKV